MKKMLDKVRKSNKGFTMVELIIVIAIIAILAAILAPQYLRFVEDARVTNDISSAKTIDSAINVLVADGTLQNGGKVTWASAGTITATSATIGTGVTAGNATNDLTGIIGETSVVRQSSKGKGAGDITWTVTITDGNVSIVCSADYQTWDD